MVSSSPESSSAARVHHSFITDAGSALMAIGAVEGVDGNVQAKAMASISTSAPFGMALPPMATRAGRTPESKTSA